jgi:predicted nucleic acid-binding protein
MSYLIDTDIISLAHKKHIPVELEKWLREHEAECFLSSITIAEMRYGVEIAPESHKEILARRVLETETQFAAAIEHITVESLVEWKRIAAFLKRERRTISCEDSLIAAQGLAFGHTIVTNNTAHFGVLKPLGLKVINPLA